MSQEVIKNSLEGKLITKPEMRVKQLLYFILFCGFSLAFMYICSSYHMHNYSTINWYKKENITDETLLKDSKRRRYSKMENKFIDIFLNSNKIIDDKTLKLKEIHDYIYNTLARLQNEGDCEKKKIVYCSNSDLGGFGSNVHRFVICLQIAFALDRIFFIDQPAYTQRGKFNGLADFTKLESGKCAYLKKNLTNIKNKCDFKHLNCYVDKRGFEIDNTYKLLTFTKGDAFPAPKYIPGTLPVEMNKVLKLLGVKRPWHWFTSQLLGYLLLRPNEMFAEKFKKASEEIGFRHPSVGLHFRHQDKISYHEASYIKENKFTDAAHQLFNQNFNSTKERYIYLASDDLDTLNITRKLLNSSYVVKSSMLFNKHHTKKNRNDASRETMESILMDLYFLVYCDYSIVTFSSNVGRLVWELRTSQFPYHEADKTILSMDQGMFYGWIGYDVGAPYYLTINDNNKTYFIQKDVTIISYKKGVLLMASDPRSIARSNGLKMNLRFGSERSKPAFRGHFKMADLVAWPGVPTYINDIV